MPQQRVHAQLVLVQHGLLVLRMIVPTIQLVAEINMHLLLAQLQRIPSVLTIHHAVPIV